MSTEPMPPPEIMTRERALRLLPISANLLPTEIVIARRVREVRRLVIAGVGAFAVVLIAWFVLATYQVKDAQNDLTASEDRVTALQRQQKAYGEVVAVQGESNAVSLQLTTLLARDLPWSTLLSNLQNAAPKDVTLSMVDGALTDEAQQSTDIRLPGTSTAKTVGSVSLTGNTTDLSLLADYMDRLSKAVGLGNVTLSGVTRGEETLQFTLNIEITDKALGGRFSAAGADKTGSD